MHHLIFAEVCLIVTFESIPHSRHSMVGCPITHLWEDLSFPVDTIPDTKSSPRDNLLVEIEEIQLTAIEHCLREFLSIQRFASMRLEYHHFADGHIFIEPLKTQRGHRRTRSLCNDSVKAVWNDNPTSEISSDDSISQSIV